MGATLRTTVIRRLRQRREKRQKLRRKLAQVSGAERQAVEAKLAKTYRQVPAEPQAKAPGDAPTA